MKIERNNWVIEQIETRDRFIAVSAYTKWIKNPLMPDKILNFNEHYYKGESVFVLSRLNTSEKFAMFVTSDNSYYVFDNDTNILNVEQVIHLFSSIKIQFPFDAKIIAEVEKKDIVIARH